SSARLPLLPSFPTRRSSDLVGRVDVALLLAVEQRAEQGRVGVLAAGAQEQGVDAQARRRGLRVLHPGTELLGVELRGGLRDVGRSEEHTSELQSRVALVCRL